MSKTASKADLPVFTDTELVPVKWCAAKIHVSPDTLWRAIRLGKLAAKGSGTRNTRVKHADVLAWLDAQ